MADCENYFIAHGVPFLPDYQDLAVYTVRSDPGLTIFDKKPLIICWFDTTYGNWNGLRYELNDSRAKMSAWLTRNNYASFEAFLGG